MTRILSILLVLLTLLSCDDKDKEIILIVKGSEGMIHLLKQADKSLVKEENSPYYIIKKNPRYKLHFVGGGSSRGLAAMIDQTVDIAISNHPFSFSDTLLLKKYHTNLILYSFAQTEIIFVVNLNNPINNLDIPQLRNVFTGLSPQWTLIKKELIKSDELQRSERRKIKTQAEKEKIKEKFIETEKIILFGRGNTSGNNFWVDNKVIMPGNISKEIRVFTNDQEIITQIQNVKYSISYVDKIYFRHKLTEEAQSKLQKKLGGTRKTITKKNNQKTLNSLLMGQNVKQLIIFDNTTDSPLSTDKIFHIRPTVYLATPEKTSYDLEPVIELLYSKEIKDLLEKHGLKPLPRSQENKELVPAIN